MSTNVAINMSSRLKVTLCNHNFSREGVFHPDRIMDEYDLLFMQNGEWTIIEDDCTYHLVPGSVLLLEPGKHHYSETKCSPMMRNVYIHFTASGATDSATSDSAILYSAISNSAILNSKVSNSAILNSTVSDQALYVPKISQISDHKEIHHSFEKVIDAFWSDDASGKELRGSMLLENLLLQLTELSRTSTYNKTDILVSEIIHRFHCEPEVFLSPEELAQNYNVSVRTMSGRFKEHTGMSIHQYQLQLKLDMAYDMLPISPGRSLHDIALSYGFYDEFQFSKLFKRKFGISPSERR